MGKTRSEVRAESTRKGILAGGSAIAAVAAAAAIAPAAGAVLAVPAAFLGWRWWRHRAENGLRI